MLSSVLIILALFSWVLCGCSGPARARTSSPAQSSDPWQVAHRLGRGINILGYDPIWRDPAQARFKVEYFKLIRDAGFNHVRLNLHPFRDNPGLAAGTNALSQQYLQTLDWAISNALAAGLMVVVDFHEFTLMGREPERCRTAFLNTWAELAAHLQRTPHTVLFELLNEPNSKLTPELWNQYLREALAVVRKTNPDRTVIIGPGQWNSIRALDQLQLPPDDTNIIVTIHYYDPFEFTHQGAAFAGRADKTGIHWGSEADRAAVIADFDRASAWAQRNGRPLYLGEFGVYDRAPEHDRAQWLAFVARQAESRGWPWAYWQFDSDFVAFDVRTGQWVQPVLNALIPRNNPPE